MVRRTVGTESRGLEENWLTDAIQAPISSVLSVELCRNLFFLPPNWENAAEVKLQSIKSQLHGFSHEHIRLNGEMINLVNKNERIEKRCILSEHGKSGLVCCHHRPFSWNADKPVRSSILTNKRDAPCSKSWYNQRIHNEHVWICAVLSYLSFL